MVYILHKLAPGWGLPSLSPACIQAEALLRFAGVEFGVQVTKEAAKSPTGFLPALEQEDSLAPAFDLDTEFDAARHALGLLEKLGDSVDGHLDNAQRALVKALSRLVQNDLEPATLYAVWVEREGFRLYKKVMGGALPFPLNVAVPLEQRRKYVIKYKNSEPEDIYKAACSAIDAIADFLEGQGEKSFCFGETPSSLDAILYGHLLFYRLSPVVAPILQKQLDGHSVLKRYTDRISEKYFSNVAPAPPLRTWADDVEDGSTLWSDAAHGREQEAQANKDEEEPVENQRMKKWGKVWLFCAGLSLLAYSYYHPPPIQIVRVDGLEGLGDEDDDDDM